MRTMAKDPIQDRIDETIHQRTRLAIMVTLAGAEGLEFGDLKGQLGLSDGNLSTHAGALERAGYVKIAKRFSRLALACVAGDEPMRHPCFKQPDSILEKLRHFHHEHQTPIDRMICFTGYETEGLWVEGRSQGFRVAG